MLKKSENETKRACSNLFFLYLLFNLTCWTLLGIFGEKNMRLIPIIIALIYGFLPSQILADECDGVPSILRISNYLPGGSEQGLRDASKAHEDWYRKNGVDANDQFVIPILDVDPQTDEITKNKNRVATLHVNSPASIASRKNQDDISWKAFLKMYAANTDVQETIFLCLPQGLLREQE